MRNPFDIYKYIDKKKKWIVLIGRFVNGGVVLAQPLILSKALHLEQEGLSYGKILSLTLYGFSVYLAIYSLMLLANHSHNVFRREIQNSIRSKLFHKVIANPAYSHNDKITLLTQDMEFLGDRYLEPIDITLSWGFVAIVTSIYIIMQDVLLGSIFVFFTILRPIPQFIMNQRLQDTGEALSKLRTDVHDEVSDSVNGSEVLISNQSMSKSFQRVYRVMQNYQKAIQDYCFTHNVVFFFNGFMVFFSQVLPLAVGFYLAMNGQAISIASLITMYIAADNLVGPIQNVMYQVVEIQGAQAVADKIFTILEEEPDFVEDDRRLVSGIERLCVSQLAKGYDGRQLFSDLDLTVGMGEKVLIKGASGSGKTTLFRLILGQEVADQGSIAVQCADGSQALDFQSNIATISQHPFLFNDTIRYNLTLGQDFTDEQLLQVLSRVGLTEEFEDILDVVVKNNGENISGGQRVRIEIARVLLRDKDILLADEVTAALDEENAKVVRDLLFSLPIMVLEIAHHISEDYTYDQVLVVGA